MSQIAFQFVSQLLQHVFMLDVKNHFTYGDCEIRQNVENLQNVMFKIVVA